MVGGILDFYFFSGPTDVEVIAQYGAMIGYPVWQPTWGFGFHLCRYLVTQLHVVCWELMDYSARWGYVNISEDVANVAAMRAANIPLEGVHFI